MKKVFVLLAIILCTAQVFAQTAITGKVLDSDGAPIPGANVMAKGIVGVGTITDLEGDYTLEVPSNATTLVFSFVGMKQQEVEIGQQTTINVTLESEDQNLEEVLIVGYGTARKETLTSSVSTLDAEKVEAITVSSFESAMQGNTAGVIVTTPLGQPGSFANVTIRGIGSVKASNQPLYVVDGIPVLQGASTSWAPNDATNLLSSLNPADIATMTVMKDAAAVAIYGSRAANGVVIITTKGGKKGKGTTIDFNTEYGISTVTERNTRMVNSNELLELQREAVDNARDYFNAPEYDWSAPNGDYHLPDSLTDVNTDWWDAVTQLGQFQSYNLSARGGSDKTDFFASLSYYDQEGTIIGTRFDRISARANFNHDINDRLSFGMNTAVSSSKQDYTTAGWAWENPVAASFWILPYAPVHNEDGTYNWNLLGSNGNYNPVANIEHNRRGNKTLSIVNSSYINYEILPELTFKTTFGIDWKNIKDEQWISPQTLYGQELNGGVYERSTYLSSWTSTTTLSYDKIFNEQHSLNALGGFEAYSYDYSYLYSGGTGATDDIPYLAQVSDNQEVGSTISERTTLSYFGRANYSFNGKYYAAASLRRDGSSNFGKNYRWATFWSGSIGWTISKEDFFNITAVDFLKVRASYGTSGNSSLSDLYAPLGRYATTIYNNSSSLYLSTLENPNLRWETQAAFNVGLDFSILNRISGTFEYFNNLNKDILLDDEISYTSGKSEVISNLGEIANRGIEIQLTTQNFIGEFKWTTDFNISLPTSEVLKLNGPDFITNGSWQRRRIGGSFSEWYLHDYAGVDPANGLALWYDDNGNITYNQADSRRVYAGSPQPDSYGGLTNTFSYKGFELSFMFYFVYGNEVLFSERIYTEHDGVSAMNSPVNANQLNRWQKPGDITDVPKPILDNPTSSNTWLSTRWLEDGSYLRLKNIRLSYNLPKNWLNKLKMSNAKLYVKGVNLYTWSYVSGMDAEVGPYGYSYNAYPVPKTVVIGLNASF